MRDPHQPQYMQAQEGASERTQLDCQDTNGATDHPMQQHSIHMVIGSDAFAQDRGKAPRCATTDQEGVVYLLPLLPSRPGPGDFNLCLSSLRFFLFYLHISYVRMYIFFCPALYLMFSAVDVASQWGCRRRCLFAINHLVPFPSSFLRLSVPPALPFASCALYTVCSLFYLLLT